MLGGAAALPFLALLLYTAPVAVVTTGCASLSTNNAANVVANLVDGIVAAGGPLLLQMELKDNPSAAPAVTNDLEAALLGLEVLQNQTNAITQAQIDAALAVANFKTPQAQAYAAVILAGIDAACGAATAAGINSVAFLPQFLNAVETAISNGLGMTPSSLNAFRAKHGFKLRRQ